MTPFRAFLLGAAAYGLILLATIPAAMIAPRVSAASGGQVKLSNATGTVWSGSASMDIAMHGVSLDLDDVRWRFLPLRLPAGRVAFAVEARAAALRANGEISRSAMAWQVSDLHASGDASAFADLHPLAAAWQPAGAIEIEVPHFTWDGTTATGGATAEWREAALVLSEVRPLGNWRAQATADGAALKFTLSTTKGPLRLAGNGTLAMTGHLALAGEARADPGHERELDGLLNLFGPRRADGAHAIEVR